MDLKPYTDLITSQHRNRPRYMAWVRFLASLFDVDIGKQMVTLFDAHSAKGHQLDIIGELVGVDRNFPPINTIPGYEQGLTDDTYRRLILAKIVRNQFKGQQGSLQNLWEAVFESDILAVFKDNQDMTMDVELIGDYTPIDIELVLHGYIVPKPLGVGMKVNMTTEINAKTLGVAASLGNSADVGILFFYYDPQPAHIDLYRRAVLGSLYGKTEVSFEYYDPLPDHITVYGGAGFGSVYGKTAIDFEYQDPEPTATGTSAGEKFESVSGLTHIESRYADPNKVIAVTAAGISPMIISGTIAIHNYAKQAYHPSARISCGSNVDANTACITILSADMEGVDNTM